MSIENNLKRIADALETIASNMSTTAAAPAPVDAPAAPAPATPLTAGDTLDAPVVTSTAPVAPTAGDVSVPTPAPVAPAPALVETPAPAPAATPAAALSAEEMNTLLVAEFKRIGDRAPIDAAMSSLGVISVTDLPADKQQSLIAAVAAIPSAA